MIKLTYKEVRDFAVIPTIEAAKERELPFPFSYWLLKVYRKLKRETDTVDQSLRDLLKSYVVLDEQGNIKQAESTFEEQPDGTKKEVPPQVPYTWKSATAQEEHQAAFKQKAKEALDIEFAFPEIEPFSFESLQGRDMPVAILAGIEPLTAEYQSER